MGDKKKKSHICELCPSSKTYKTHSELRSHQRSHPEMAQIETCEYPACGAQFKHSASRVRHQKNHEPQLETFICIECSKSYSRKETMERHQRSSATCRYLLSQVDGQAARIASATSVDCLELSRIASNTSADSSTSPLLSRNTSTTSLTLEEPRGRKRYRAIRPRAFDRSTAQSPVRHLHGTFDTASGEVDEARWTETWMPQGSYVGHPPMGGYVAAQSFHTPEDYRVSLWNGQERTSWSMI